MKCVGSIAGLLLLAGFVMAVSPGCSRTASVESWSMATRVTRAPQINPDYSGLMIPPNLAPLNFVIEESGQSYRVEIQARQGRPIQLFSRQPQIRIPLGPWRQLLQANRGEPLHLDIGVQQADGGWQRFSTLTNTIAREDIDGYLVYRLLNYQFSLYGSGTIGIYQRNLQNFEQRTVLCVKDHRPGSATCVNCHTFSKNQPDPLALHIRNELHGKPMLVAHGDHVTTVGRPAGLLSWHPSGKAIAFSLNKFSMLFHSLGRVEDVVDSAGDLGVYYLADQRVGGTEKIATADYFETWPSWSPDGQYLYFCRCHKLTSDRYLEAQYDLVRIRYDLEKDSWGDVETVLSAQETGLSIAQPRISPDGQYLLFCMCPYSSFPGTQPGSDLYLLNLNTRQYRCLDEINSPHSDSWHSWSSNGRWFVFSSKRRDRLLTRPYFSHFDEQGRLSKPLLLPQEDPTFYDSFLKFFNLPELVTGPVKVSERSLFNAVFNPKDLVKPVGEVTAKGPDRQHSDAPSPKNEPDTTSMR